MIVVKLTGGLGNQLFQYAMGKYLATRANAELVIEDSFYIDTPAGSTPRNFELGQYAIDARRTTESERRALTTYSGKIWKRLRRMLPLPGPLRYVYEPAGQFIPYARDVGDRIFLDGYWQSEKYFSGIEEIIRAELRPITPMSASDKEVAEKMKQSGSVSVHIRRGDYLTNAAANATHGLCDLAYYEKACALLAEKLDNPKFFIFSDDLDWVLTHLKIPFESIYVGHNSASMAVQDLRLMSHCKHHIIANSSFSWWGAWLNPNPEKIVVRPKTWYVGLPEAGTWTCPSHWTAL